MRKLFAGVLFFSMPFGAHAAVLINEVAWMGTTASANAEWIELTNTSNAPVDLTGWKLTSSTGSPTITLSGTIAASGYFLLERTSDDTVPGIPADQIYTGSLSNSGATLTLTDASGAAVDTVDGGGNWATIGGDNASKQTAQRTANGWETADPTPRAANAGVSSSGAGDSSDSGTSIPSTASSTTVAAATGGGGPPQYAPIPNLRVVAGSDRTVVAQADVAYAAQVYANNGALRDDAVVTWAFGDGMSRTGNSVTHAYYAPGEYEVVAHAVTSDGGDQYASFVVTVVTAGVTITNISAQGITLKNSNANPIDLSNWKLVANGSTFTFPPNTQILAGKSVLFPTQVTELVPAGNVALLFSSGEVAALWPNTAPLAKTQPLAQAPGSYKVQDVGTPAGHDAASSALSVTAPAYHATEPVLAPATSTELAAAGASVPVPPKKSLLPWSLGLGSLLVVSAGAFILL